MPGIGIAELVIVGLLALIIFGPKRLPEMARSLGRGLREFKGSVSDDERRFAPPVDEIQESASPVVAATGSVVRLHERSLVPVAQPRDEPTHSGPRVA